MVHSHSLTHFPPLLPSIYIFDFFSNLPFKKLQLKLAMYFSWTVGNNVENQRKGLVVIVWYDRSFFVPIRPVVNKYKLHEMLTVRCCALHCCTPDTPVYRLRRAFFTMKVSHLRMKLRIHVGTLRCVTLCLFLFCVLVSGTMFIYIFFFDGSRLFFLPLMLPFSPFC